MVTLFSLCFIIKKNNVFQISTFAKALWPLQVLVKKQQRVWEELSRSGSTRYRGSHNSRHGIKSQKRQMEGNVKAIFTTLLILGSCVVGWVPAVITYIIVCSTGCPYSGSELRKIQMEHYVLFFYINFVVNLLIILKTLANPIIYSFRMAEIKVIVLYILRPWITFVSRRVLGGCTCRCRACGEVPEEQKRGSSRNLSSPKACQVPCGRV